MLTVVLVLHAIYVAFVITAPVFVLHAALARAPWSRALRWAHGAAVAFITLQFSFDWRCPLSVLENALTGRALDVQRLPPLDGHEAVIGFVVVAYLALSLVGHALALRPHPEPAS